MIDNRFSLDADPDYQHLMYLTFSVTLPPERYYSSQSGLILDICKKQYPELDFEYQGNYSARFTDGQYARCIRCIVENSYVTKLTFSMTLNVDSIMSAVCGFKNHIKPLQFTVNPVELSTITPEEFLEIVSDMYAELSIFIKVTKVSWTFDRIDSTNESVYMIQPTEYNYV